MCYTSTIINLNHTKDKKNIALGLCYQIEGNKDGFSFMRDTGKPERTLNIKEAKRKTLNLLSENAFNILTLHFRLATNGKVNEENIHLWEKDNFIFSHNGIVYGLNDDKNKSDSRIFFNHFIKEISKKKRKSKNVIKTMMSLCGRFNFYGRCILIDKTNNLMYFFGDFSLQLIPDNCLIIGSSPINLSKTSYISFGDVYFSDETPLERILDKKIEGVHILNIETLKIKEYTIGQYISEPTYCYPVQQPIGFETENKTLTRRHNKDFLSELYPDEGNWIDDN